MPDALFIAPAVDSLDYARRMQAICPCATHARDLACAEEVTG